MRSRLFVDAAGACMLGLASAGAPAQAVITPLNDTGMLKCIDASGVYSWSCEGSGQDAESGRDVAFPSEKNGRVGFAFAKVCNTGEAAGTGTCPANAEPGAGPDNWGCTLDRVTGLVWEVKTLDGGLHDEARTFVKLSDAQRFAAEVNRAGHCGKKDWRLPGRHELQGLVSYIAIWPPAIDDRWFPNTPGGSYWTTALSAPEAYPTAISFDTGRMEAYKGAAGFKARLVRGGSRVSPSRFVADGAQVKDSATGLVWQRCSEGQQWSGNGCGSAPPRQLAWQEALDLARAFARATGVAWRLPNVKELNSLVDTTLRHPAVDTRAFPGDNLSDYWSSTPSPGLTGTAPTTAAWSVSLDSGLYQTGIDSAAVRLVRDDR